MEKKIYVPTTDDLYIMQDLGANIYQYLLIKTVESLIIEGLKYKNKGMLKSAYKYIRENPDIAHAICLLYPQELEYSECAKYDVLLCESLISRKNSASIYELDNLSKFKPIIQNNISILNKVISCLGEELPNNPKYRFTYKSSELLDNIFGVKLDNYHMITPSNYECLSAIEPAYALKFLNELSVDEIKKLLKYGMNKYLERYGLDRTIGYEYANKDVLTSPDTNIKRLIKCINQNKENIY